MMNELYQVHDLQYTDANLTCRISYNATHPIFSGHFPNQPVVPGVCTMDMIKELLQTAIGKGLLLVKAPQVKFLQLILPDVAPEVNIGWKDVDGDLQVTASLKAGDAFTFKMSGNYRVQ